MMDLADPTVSVLVMAGGVSAVLIALAALVMLAGAVRDVSIFLAQSWRLGLVRRNETMMDHLRRRP